uniref:Uncharacterized protein n=1 Tax=Ciona savignyi TaxID=51511 RepID=H2Z7A1_CIOSA
MEDRNNELQREMITLKEEITLLQETVQRECEERFELTEALSQARDDLKLATGIRGSQTSFSAPVSALNRLHPGQFESNGPQLSGVTLKRLEAEGISPRSPGNNLPSLRSMPDLLPRREATNNAGKSSPAHPPTPPNASVTTHVRDLSFQSTNGSPKRSHSGGSRENYQQRKSYSEPNGIHHSKSADTVDTVRRRIAAAIKRK